jgi:hypothetical protein
VYPQPTPTRRGRPTVRMDSRITRPKALWLLLGVPAALLLVVLTFESIGGTGHPPLSAVLLFWASYPTLAGYLSRSLGSDFPSTLVMFLGFLEYALVVVGLASLIARSQGRIVAGGRTAMAALFMYVSAQCIAHLLLNLQAVNIRLMADANPRGSMAAVNRIRDSGDIGAVPALQRKLIEDFERDGTLEAGLLDALTALGGARGWQDLLKSGRLGVTGPAARAWRFIVENVRAMANPPFAEARGGIKSRYFGAEDIARFFDSLALELAEQLRGAPDSEASLTLLAVMKERPDLCRKYFELVPIGLRDAAPQAASDLVGTLALMKAGPAADFKYDYQAMITKNEMSRFARDRDAVAEEWIAWAKSNIPCR